MTRGRNWRSLGFCGLHRKQLYVDRNTAKQVARLHQGQHKSAYRCGPEHPGMYHIGGLPKEIIAGTASRRPQPATNYYTDKIYRAAA